MKNLTKLLLSQVQDPTLQENFVRIAEFFRTARALIGFEHLELTIAAPGTEQKIPHGLGYTPKDLIVTRITGPALVSWNYDKFDSTYLNYTVVAGTPTAQDPIEIRAYVGTHIKGDL